VGEQGAKSMRPYVVMTDTRRMMDEVRYDIVELTPSLCDSEFVKGLPVTLDKLICMMDLFEKISGP
jgi:hypothetical protein